uniref:Uncharacterized protein n=1 Tax=viral metagenome TaxID=1070528 RepID=A0A6C0HM03_9ZZZZ
MDNTNNTNISDVDNEKINISHNTDINTDLDETNITTTLDNITLSTDKLLVDVTSVKRAKFAKTCEYCQKIFKAKKTYETHIYTQACKSLNEITYCKICDLTCETHQQYKKHLTSLRHNNKIQTIYGIVETIDVTVTPPINTADPYLTSDDVDTITKKSLGNNFTINYKDGRDSHIVKLVKQTVSNTRDTGNTPATLSSIDQNTSIQNNLLQTTDKPQALQALQKSQALEPLSASASHSIQHHVDPIEATPRQAKIITYLEGYKNIANCGDKLIEILKEKLQIEDYKHLQTLLQQSPHLSSEMKEAYVGAINKFSMAMVKLKNKGVSTFKDKDITMIVMNLNA